MDPLPSQPPPAQKKYRMFVVIAAVMVIAIVSGTMILFSIGGFRSRVGIPQPSSVPAQTFYPLPVITPKVEEFGELYPAFYVTIHGTMTTTIQDDHGNMAIPWFEELPQYQSLFETGADDTAVVPTIIRLMEGVPGVTMDTLEPGGVSLVIPDYGSYDITLGPEDDSTVEVEAYYGYGSPESSALTMRYLDFSLPPGQKVRLRLSPRGLTPFIGVNADGTAGTTVYPPTAVVSGDMAKDTTGPQVQISRQLLEGSRETIQLIATDDLSGVKDIRYSLDGTTYEWYTEPFIVDTKTVPVIFTFADDQAGNRNAGRDFPLTDKLSLRLYVHPLSGKAPLEVTGLAKAYTNYPPVTIDWNFGDGIVLLDSLADSHHTFGSPGRYQVQVSVTDVAQRKASQSVIVFVQ